MSLEISPLLRAALFTAILGLLVPSILIRIGYSLTLTIAFTIAMLAFLIDGFVTKMGLCQNSLQETNPILTLLIRRFTPNVVLIATRAVGIGILLYGLLILDSSILLFGVALGYLMIDFMSIIALQRSLREFLVSNNAA
jgi:hypothetical protein